MLKTMIVMDSTVHISENYVYGDVDQQLLYVKIYKEFWDLREKFLEKEEWELGHRLVTPVTPDIASWYAVLQ